MLDPRELESLTIVSHLMQVLETEPRFGAREAGVLNHGAISPASLLTLNRWIPSHWVTPLGLHDGDGEC